LELKRQQVIDTDLSTVWAALNDDKVLKASIPGCESLERTEPDTIRAVVKIKIGPVGARFAGLVTFSDQKPPHGYKLTFEGQGGAAGFAKGHAVVSLSPFELGKTLLTYEAHAEVGGRLAQIGSRLIDNVAAKTAEEFFKAFSRQVAPDTEFGESIEEPRVRTAWTSRDVGRTSQDASPLPRSQALHQDQERKSLAALQTSISIIAGSSVTIAIASVIYVLHNIL